MGVGGQLRTVFIENIVSEKKQKKLSLKVSLTVEFAMSLVGVLTFSLTTMNISKLYDYGNESNNCSKWDSSRGKKGSHIPYYKTLKTTLIVI